MQIEVPTFELTDDNELIHRMETTMVDQNVAEALIYHLTTTFTSELGRGEYLDTGMLEEFLQKNNLLISAE